MKIVGLKKENLCVRSALVFILIFALIAGLAFYLMALNPLGGVAHASVSGLVAADTTIPITVTNDAAKPWLAETDAANIDGTNPTYKSDIKGIDSGNTALTLKFTASTTSEFVFRYKISSETNWDYLKITHNGAELTKRNTANMSGTVDWTEYSFIVAGSAAEQTITLAYSKDGGGNRGSDTLWISSCKFVNIEWAGGDGTQASPYLINSGKLLNKLAADVRGGTDDFQGKYVKLSADINLGGVSWKPIGYENSAGVITYFRGNFDGDNHKINGLKLDREPINSEQTSDTFGGLFGYVAGGSIKNFTVVSPVVIKGYDSKWTNSGIVCGNINNGEIINVTVTGANAEFWWWCGLMTGKMSNSRMENCFVKDSTVTIHDWVFGGLAGSCTGSTVINSGVLNTTINSLPDSWDARCGGLFGFLSESTVDGCVFDGKITALHNFAGGIYAFDEGGSSNVIIKNCEVYGSISGGNYVGGVLGGELSDIQNTVIENCVNYADITASGSNAGGIAGFLETEGLTVRQCANTGTVTAGSNAGELIGGGKELVSLTCTEVFPEIVSMSQKTPQDILVKSEQNCFLKGYLEIGPEVAFSITFASAPQFEIRLDKALLVEGTDYTVTGNVLSFISLPVTSGHILTLITNPKTEADGTTYSAGIRASLVINIAEFAEMPDVTVTANGVPTNLNTNNRLSVMNYDDGNAAKTFDLALGTAISGVTVSISLSNGASAASFLVGGVYKFKGFTETVTITVSAAQADKVTKTLSFTLVYNPFSGGFGTTASPYIITRPLQFSAMKGDLYYELGSDVDFTGAGEYTAAWQIGRFVLDGKGYSVKNFKGSNYENRALLGGVYGKCIIKNLNFADCDVDCTADDGKGIALLCNYIADNESHETDILFENVHIKGKVINAYKFGAFFVRMDGSKVDFKNCSVDIDFTGNGQSLTVGGFVCEISDKVVDPTLDITKNVKFENCIFNGTFSNADSIGGFVGQITQSSAAFINCRSNGKITNANDFAGGFIANISFDSTYVFEDCFNYTNIKCDNTTATIGALIAYNEETATGTFTGIANAGVLEGGAIRGLIGNLELYSADSFALLPFKSVSHCTGEPVSYSDSYGNRFVYVKYTAHEGDTDSVTIFLTEMVPFRLYIDGELKASGTDYTVDETGIHISVPVIGAYEVTVMFLSTADPSAPASILLYELDMTSKTPEYTLTRNGTQSAVTSGQVIELAKDETGEFELAFDMAGINNSITVEMNGEIVNPAINGTFYTYGFTVLNGRADFVITVRSENSYHDSVTRFTVVTKYAFSATGNNPDAGRINGSFENLMMHGSVITLDAVVISDSYIFAGWYINYGLEGERLLETEDRLTYIVSEESIITAVFRFLTQMPAVTVTGGPLSGVTLTGNRDIVQLIDTTSNYVFTFPQGADGVTVSAVFNGTTYVFDASTNTITVPVATDGTLRLIAHAEGDSVDKVYALNIRLLKFFPTDLVTDDSIRNSQITNNTAYPFEHDKSIAGRTAYKSTHNIRGTYGITVMFSESGVFSFDYKVLTPDSANYSLDVSLNGKRILQKYGDIGWTTFNVYIPAGNNTIVISYARTTPKEPQADEAIWVSNFSFTKLETNGKTGDSEANVLVIENMETLLGKLTSGGVYYLTNADNMNAQYLKFNFQNPDSPAFTINSVTGASYTQGTGGIYGFAGLRAGDNRITFSGTNAAGVAVQFVLNINNPGLDGFPNIVNGRGEPSNPYVITEIEDIEALRRYTDKYFMLDYTLNCSNGTWEVDPISQTVTFIGAWSPIGTSASKFGGGFNGNGWTIVISDVADSAAHRGFFGFTLDAKIRGLKLIITERGTSASSFGGLIAQAEGITEVRNAEVTVNVDIPASNMGGLVAAGGTAEFYNCKVYGSINNKSSKNTGGLAALGGKFYICTMYADVSGIMLVGGLVGGYKQTSTFADTYMAGTVSMTGTHNNNYPYFGQVNGYGAWVTFTLTNSGVLLTVRYNRAADVSRVDVFNGELAPVLVSSTDNSDGSCIKIYKMHLKTVYADGSLLNETKVNGVTGNYGGFTVRFTMNDGTLKYVSNYERANTKFNSNLNVNLDALTSYVDNFALIEIDSQAGTSGRKEIDGISVFGTAIVGNANDFEHMHWIVNGGIPTTFAGGYIYNQRSVATLSVGLSADIDLTSDRMANGKYLNRSNGAEFGDKLYQFYGFGVGEMHPYRGSLYGNGHTLTVNMDFPNAYLVGIIAMSSDMDNNVVVSELTVKGVIRGKYRVGIVGMFDGYLRSGTLTMSGVVSNADISGVNHVGGLIGVLHNVNRVDITNCTVKSRISPITGPRTAAFIASQGDWGVSNSSKIYFSGRNRDFTLLPVIGGLDIGLNIMSSSSFSEISRNIILRYGNEVGETVTVSAAATATSVSVSEIVISGAAVTFPTETFIFNANGTLTREFKILILYGTLTKTYDGNSIFNVNSSNYYGSWELTGGNVSSNGVNANAAGYTEFEITLTANGTPKILNSGLKGVINKKDVTFTFADMQKIYNGTEQSVTITANGFVESSNQTLFEIQYSGNRVNKGNCAVTVRLSEAGNVNYTLIGLSETVMSIEAREIEVIVPDGYVFTKEYGASEPIWNVFGLNGVTLPDGAVENVDIRLGRVSDEMVGLKTGAVTASVVGNANYIAVMMPRDFEIIKANPAVTLNNITVDYNGNPVVVSSADASGFAGAPAQPSGAFTYEYFSDEACNLKLDYAPVNHGTYWVKATVAADGNYNSAKSAAATLVINKVRPVITGNPTAGGIFIGQTLQDSVFGFGSVTGVGNMPLEGCFEWKTPTLAPTESGQFAFAFKPADSLNYFSVDGTVSLTVTQLYVTFKEFNKTTEIPVNYGASIMAVSFPTLTERAGYTVRWSVETDIDDITSQTTVNAVYTPIIYTLTYDLDGGTAQGNPDNYTVESDAFTLSAPTKEGYTFIGWTGTDILEPSLSVTVEKGSLGNMAYTANWKINAYALTVVSVHGTVICSIDGFISGNELEFGTQLTLTATADTGYRFAYWRVDGGQIPVTSNVYVFTMASSAKTVEAVFAAESDISYKVEHYTENLVYTGESDRWTMVTSEDLFGTTGSTVTAASKGYTGFSTPTDMPGGIIAGDGSLVIKVYYTRNSYAVTLSGAAEHYKFGTVIALPSAEKTGFTFKGYRSSHDGNLYNGEYTVPAADATLDKMFELNAPSVSLGGNITETYGSTVILTAAVTHALASTASYEWYFNAGLINGEIGVSLSVRDVAQSGNYKVKITITADGQTKTAEASVIVGILNADMTVTAQNYNAEYDGEYHGIAVNAPEGAVIEYKVGEGEWSVNNPTYRNITPIVTVLYRVSKVNYNTVESSASITVTARRVFIKLNNQSSEYNGSEPIVSHVEFTATQGSIVEGDDLGIVISKAGGVSFGTYTLTAVWNNNPNYELNIADSIYTVTKRAVEITLTAQSSIYDGTEPVVSQTAYTVTKGSIITGDTLDIDILKDLGSGAEAYRITGAFNNANYAVTFINGTFEIKKRALTLTIADKESRYDGSEPSVSTLSYNITIGSLVEGDTLGVVLSKEAGKNVGRYSITAIWNNNSNYEIEIVSGVYTITTVPLTVVIGDAASVYGSVSAELTYRITYGEIVFGDSVPFELYVADASGIPLDVSAADAKLYGIRGRTVLSNYEISFRGNGEGGEAGVYTINRKEVSAAGISFEFTAMSGNIEIPFDGEIHLPVPTGLPVGISEVKFYSDRELTVPFAGIDSGSARMWAKFISDKNHYVSVGTETAVLVMNIVVKTITINWNYQEEYIYSGEILSGSMYAEFINEKEERVRLTVDNGGITFGEYVEFRNAGGYIAELVLPAVYSLSEGSFKQMEFTIEQACIDMSGISFLSKEAFYTGGRHNIAIGGILPTGVTVVYTDTDGNAFRGQSDEGIYTVEARFEADNANFKLINLAQNPLTATLTIARDTDSESAFVDAVDKVGVVNAYSGEAIDNADKLYNALPYTGSQSVVFAKAELDRKAAELRVIVQNEIRKEVAFQAAALYIGRVTENSFELIKDAMDMYNSLAYKDNVTAGKSALDVAIDEYNAIVTRYNAELNAADDVIEKALGEAVAAISLLGVLAFMAFKFN